MLRNHWIFTDISVERYQQLSEVGMAEIRGWSLSLRGEQDLKLDLHQTFYLPGLAFIASFNSKTPEYNCFLFPNRQV